MNERIKELAEQAGIKLVLVLEQWKTIDALTDYEQEELQRFEKFAELIVRECANVALEQKKWVEDMIVFNRQDEQWNLARIQQSQRIVDKIKERFGVEE